MPRGYRRFSLHSFAELLVCFSFLRSFYCELLYIDARCIIDWSLSTIASVPSPLRLVRHV